MPPHPQDNPSQLANPDAYSWRPLAILTVYRMVIVATIGVAFLGTRSTDFLQTADPGRFRAILLGYFVIALLAYTPVRHRWPAFLVQVCLQVGLDIFAITLLILASGTLGNGLGALMVVAIAGGSILVGVRIAALFAASASLLLLGSQVLAHWRAGVPGVDYSQAGFLGITIFVTALAGSLLARRARQTQALADRRGVDLEGLEALNGHIVHALQSGVVAIDRDDRVQLVNAAAWNLLGRPLQMRGANLDQLSPTLAAALHDWRENPLREAASLNAFGTELTARFRPVGTDARQGTLIFVDGTAILRAQVQQAKLASIGRLTSNIAHEIRNPLGAITHAAQLLEESPELADGDRRLVEIMRKQGARLNRVVENVLQLSRRQPPNDSDIPLSDWLEGFARDFHEQYPQRDVYRLELKVETGLTIRFDPDHLHQVLTNLCRNAVQHGRGDGRVTIRLSAWRRGGGGATLEIADDGVGITREAQERLFEPFFTTSSSGTGLGLYLCEELCAGNRAHLSLAPAARGTCFHIGLATPTEEAAPA